MPIQNNMPTGRTSYAARFMTSPTRFILILCAVFTLTSLTACGDESDNKKPTVVNNRPGNQDVGVDADPSDPDTGVPDSGKQEDVDEPKDTDKPDTDDQDTRPDPDTPPENDTNIPPDTSCGDRCIASEICVAGECVDDTADRKCRDATDLGQLKLGIKKTAEGTLRRVSNVIATACGPGEDQTDVGAEAVFKFTVEQDSRIDFNAKWLGQFDGVIAFHTDSCKIPGSSMDPCFDHEQQSFHALAGHDYFMIVELSVGRGHDFTVDLTAKPVDCIPGPNANSCTDGNFNRCEGVGITSEYACADECTGAGTQCLGNSCDEPIVVTASTTFSGKNAAYNDQYDFQYIAGCEVDGEEIPTPGPEIIFMLPNLTAGQVVVVDAKTNDLNSNAIFITSNCGVPSQLSCLATAYEDEILTWTVPADGDYYVFIDKETGSGDNFEYSIDIR